MSMHNHQHHHQTAPLSTCCWSESTSGPSAVSYHDYDQLSENDAIEARGTDLTDAYSNVAPPPLLPPSYWKSVDSEDLTSDNTYPAVSTTDLNSECHAPLSQFYKSNSSPRGATEGRRLFLSRRGATDSLANLNGVIAGATTWRDDDVMYSGCGDVGCVGLDLSEGGVGEGILTAWSKCDFIPPSSCFGATTNVSCSLRQKDVSCCSLLDQSAFTNQKNFFPSSTPANANYQLIQCQEDARLKHKEDLDSQVDEEQSLSQATPAPPGSQLNKAGTAPSDFAYEAEISSVGSSSRPPSSLAGSSSRKSHSFVTDSAKQTLIKKDSEQPLLGAASVSTRCDSLSGETIQRENNNPLPLPFFHLAKSQLPLRTPRQQPKLPFPSTISNDSHNESRNEMKAPHRGGRSGEPLLPSRSLCEKPTANDVELDGGSSNCGLYGGDALGVRRQMSSTERSFGERGLDESGGELSSFGTTRAMHSDGDVESSDFLCYNSSIGNCDGCVSTSWRQEATPFLPAFPNEPEALPTLQQGHAHILRSFTYAASPSDRLYGDPSFLRTSTGSDESTQLRNRCMDAPASPLSDAFGGSTPPSHHPHRAYTSSTSALKIPGCPRRESAPSPPQLSENNEASPVRLFIGRIPKSFRSDDLRKLFRPFGPVLESNIIRDRHTSQSKGCGFVRLLNLENAKRAIAALNQLVDLDASSGPIQVKFATGELERLNLPINLQPGGECVKVFFGNLAATTVEPELVDLFKVFGDFEELCILRDEHQRSKCSGFVTFRSLLSAQASICALNGKHRVAKSMRPMEVRYAKSRNQRAATMTGNRGTPETALRRDWDFH